MKTLFTTAVLAVLIATATTAKAQDWPEEYLGLPGDNLNLYAVMNLFQESETLEGFERNLNDENSGINNLDLNGDNRVDYIMVSDYVDGNVHNIVLRVALDKKHQQDVAVFTVQQFNNGSVQIQLVGDEALYGRNYIIEPNYDNNYTETANPGYTGKPSRKVNVTVVTTSAWEIAAWPVVRYIYLPDYRIWHSPWYWGYWPSSWYAWNPWYYHYYYGYHHNWYNHYYAHYRHWDHYRYDRYHDFYYAEVRHSSKDVHKNINKGYYRGTYSRPELTKEGEALYTRTNSGTSIRTRSTAASGNSLQRSVSETARVRSTAGVAERREGSSVATRTRTEAGTIRSETGATSKSATRSEGVETSRRSVPATGSTTYSRPATTRSAGTREVSPSVSGESRTRTSGATVPEVTNKVATRPATSSRPAESTRIQRPAGNQENSRSSSGEYSGSRTRTEMAPRTTTTVRQEVNNSGSGNNSGSSSRVSTRSSSPSGSMGSTKVATRPSNSGSSSSAGNRTSVSSSASSGNASARGSAGVSGNTSSRTRR